MYTEQSGNFIDTATLDVFQSILLPPTSYLLTSRLLSYVSFRSSSPHSFPARP